MDSVAVFQEENEKAWRYINGTWYMFKQGNTQELISEYYSYHFLKAMGVNVAEYDIKNMFRKKQELPLNL